MISKSLPTLHPSDSKSQRTWISFLSPICVNPFVGGEGAVSPCREPGPTLGPIPGGKGGCLGRVCKCSSLPGSLSPAQGGRPAGHDRASRTLLMSGCSRSPCLPLDPHRALLPTLWVWGEGFHICVLLCRKFSYREFRGKFFYYYFVEL